jgi:hypothetical protein
VSSTDDHQSAAARTLACWLLLVALIGCQSSAPTSNAPLYGQSTIAPPGTANTAMANPGAFAMSAPPMPNTSQPNGWAPPPVNGGAPANNWNSPSIFGGSAPPQVNATSWNPNQPPNAYGASGSIFDQAPPTQQQGIFDSFASANTTSYPGGSFNPNSMSRGYESPNSSFTSGTPAYSANRTGVTDSSGGSWWDRLTGTKSTVPAAGNPGWNQPAPLGTPNPAVAWNDPRNPNFARSPIPNPNAPPNNGWNITAAPNSYAAPNPLSTAPNYTNYGSPAPNYSPNNIARTLPATTGQMRPTNTLPAGWGGNSPAPAATSVPASGPIAVRNLEDLPPAR